MRTAFNFSTREGFIVPGQSARPGTGVSLSLAVGHAAVMMPCHFAVTRCPPFLIMCWCHSPSKACKPCHVSKGSSMILRADAEVEDEAEPDMQHTCSAGQARHPDGHGPLAATPSGRPGSVTWSDANAALLWVITSSCSAVIPCVVPVEMYRLLWLNFDPAVLLCRCGASRISC